MHILQSLLKKNLHNKITKRLFVIFLVLNAVFITIYLVNAVQDDNSAKSVPIRLHLTVNPASLSIVYDLYREDVNKTMTGSKCPLKGGDGVSQVG